MVFNVSDDRSKIADGGVWWWDGTMAAGRRHFYASVRISFLANTRHGKSRAVESIMAT